MRYPVTLEHDSNDTVLVSFVDLAAHSVGDTEADALGHAVDALETAITALMVRRQLVPLPSIVKGQHTVALPAQYSAKVLLHNELIIQNVRKAELARRLHVHLPQVDRLLDVNHGSRLDAIEAAFAALGKGLDVRVA